MNPSPLDSLDLRDIHAAAVPESWPPAPGWWLLAALIVAGLAAAGWWLLLAWRRRQLRNRILGELDAVGSDGPARIATQVSTLLRRVALMRFERNEVACLSGSAWLAFLDATGGNGAFMNGPGSVLASAPYARQDSNGVDHEALLSLARQWIRHNLDRRA